jgi:LysM repeat protein
MAYYFYLDGVEIPVAPSKLETKINNKNRTITLINEGEVNILKKPGLTDISLSPLFPQTPQPFTNGLMPLAFYLDKFEKLKTDKKPFQFIVTRMTPGGKMLFNTNIKVSMEDYKIVEDANNGMAVVIDIKLKQYKDYGTKKITVKEQVKSNNNKRVVKVTETKVREVSKSMPKVHTVKKGDTLWTICKKNLGDGSKYIEIAELNGIKNSNLIQPGQVIRFG